jgi:SNF family Na+-dependent transporter
MLAKNTVKRNIIKIVERVCMILIPFFYIIQRAIAHNAAREKSRYIGMQANFSPTFGETIRASMEVFSNLSLRGRSDESRI